MDKKFIIGISLATLIITMGGVWLISSQNAQEAKKLNTPFLGQKIEDMGGTHVKRGEKHGAYNSNPPTSGPHWPDGTAGAGIHDSEMPDELLVHSEEHGAAILWYKSDLPQDQIEKLKDIFNGVSGKKIMVPRKNLDVAVALTSWNYLLKLDTIDEGQIKAFIETNNDRAPEKASI